MKLRREEINIIVNIILIAITAIVIIPWMSLIHLNNLGDISTYVRHVSIEIENLSGEVHMLKEEIKKQIGGKDVK